MRPSRSRLAIIAVEEQISLPTQKWCALELAAYVLKRSLKNRQSKKDGKDQESIQLSTTPGPGTIWETNKYTIKHYTQESQEVSPFPPDDHKAAMKRQENTTNTKHK